MNHHVIMDAYMDAYVDDDVDTISTHLLTSQNLRWANFWLNFSHFRSSISAILVAQFQKFWSPISSLILAHFLAHCYSTYAHIHCKGPWRLKGGELDNFKIGIFLYLVKICIRK